MTAAPAAEPLSLERFVDAVHEAVGAVPGTSRCEVFTGQNEVRVVFDYQGYEGVTVSAALPFEKMSEERKQALIRNASTWPANWRQGRRG